MPVKKSEARAPSPAASLAWTVSVRFTFDPNQDIDVHPRLPDQIAELLPGRAPVFTLGKSFVTIVFGAPGLTYPSARKDVDTVVDKLRERLGLASDAITHLRMRSNADVDSEIADLPECVGVGEAASILGVSKQRVAQLAQRPDFPEPAFRLRATPVWREADIRQFAAVRRSNK